MLVYLCLYTRTHIHVHIHVNTHTHIHTHKHTQTGTFTHTRTHTHTHRRRESFLIDLDPVQSWLRNSYSNSYTLSYLALLELKNKCETKRADIRYVSGISFQARILVRRIQGLYRVQISVQSVRATLAQKMYISLVLCVLAIFVETCIKRAEYNDVCDDEKCVEFHNQICAKEFSGYKVGCIPHSHFGRDVK